jgi:hypothetical protein
VGAAALRLALAATFATAFLAGCLPVAGPQVTPAPMQPGPTLVLAVTNLSGEDRTVEYESMAEAGSSGGLSEVSCGHTVLQFGTVLGTYQLMVDGEEVAEARVPPGADPSAYIVFELVIGEDGTTQVAGPVMARRAPQVGPTEPCR